jgi:hypothetical protein
MHVIMLKSFAGLLLALVAIFMGSAVFIAATTDHASVIFLVG